MVEYVECPFCGKKNITKTVDYDRDTVFIECEDCGRVEYGLSSIKTIKECKNEIATYLFYHKNKYKDYRSFYYIGTSKEDVADYEWAHTITKDEVLNFYNCSFSEKIDHILLNIAAKSSYMGAEVNYLLEELVSLYFVKRFGPDDNKLSDEEIVSQCQFVEDYLVEQGYIENPYWNFDDPEVSIKMLQNGWKRVDELQKNNTNNKDVFVSMAFNDGTKDTREAIRQGIIEGGFSAEFIDEIIHNKQIVPEMFRLIRECRFLILDITDPNYGAYYEAGYALGLGKEVIISCKSDVFNGRYGDYTDEELIKFEKYLKPHFDIAQKQILVWNDYEDLTNKLAEWIKALF